MTKYVDRTARFRRWIVALFFVGFSLVPVVSAAQAGHVWLAVMLCVLPAGTVFFAWRLTRVAVLLGAEGVVIRNFLEDVHASWSDVLGVEFDDDWFGLCFRLRRGDERCQAFPGSPMGRSYDEEARWIVYTEAVTWLDDWRVRHAPDA